MDATAKAAELINWLPSILYCYNDRVIVLAVAVFFFFPTQDDEEPEKVLLRCRWG